MKTLHNCRNLVLSISVLVGISQLAYGQTIMSNFYVEDGTLYWNHNFESALSIDSLQTVINAMLSSKTEVKTRDGINDHQVIIRVADFKVDCKADGKTGFSYPAIYKSGKWEFAAMISLIANGYEVRCKEFKYGGIQVSVGYFSESVEGDWEKIVVKDGALRGGANAKIFSLMDKNLMQFFTVKSRAF